MPDASPNDLLADLLILAHRSLLQYTTECFPWADTDDAAEQAAVTEMARAEEEVVARIADWLDRQGAVVDWGTYPDWTSLHFVSLEYLLKKLIADEEQLVAAIDRTLPALKSDPEASALAQDLSNLERHNLSRLRELASARKRPAVLS